MVTNMKYQTSYRILLPTQPSPPCDSTAYLRLCTLPWAYTHTPTSAASRIQASKISFRIDRRSPLAAPCSPWYSCTSWPSWDESSSRARRFSSVRNGSFALRQGRERCSRISHSTCARQFCRPPLGSFLECYSSFGLVFLSRQRPLDHSHHSWCSYPSYN